MFYRLQNSISILLAEIVVVYATVYFIFTTHFHPQAKSSALLPPKFLHEHSLANFKKS